MVDVIIENGSRGACFGTDFEGRSGRYGYDGRLGRECQSLMHDMQATPESREQSARWWRENQNATNHGFLRLMHNVGDALRDLSQKREVTFSDIFEEVENAILLPRTLSEQVNMSRDYLGEHHLLRTIPRDGYNQHQPALRQRLDRGFF